MSADHARPINSLPLFRGRRKQALKDPLHQLAVSWEKARKVGWPAALALRFSDFGVRTGLGHPRSVELKLKNIQFPVFMRTYSSDRQVLSQVFIEEEYAPIELSRPRMILDLGANVGYSSVYFLSKYPTARVLAVEADPDNYAMCWRNLKPFGERARVLLGAAWVECAKLVLSRGAFRDGREWSTQVRQPTAAETSIGSAEVDGYDMPALISLCEATEIDLLKIDIEGSEFALFSRDTDSWLPKVRNLCIELHGPDCEEVFFRALSGHFYDLIRSGELTMCLNLRCP